MTFTFAGTSFLGGAFQESRLSLYSMVKFVMMPVSSGRMMCTEVSVRVVKLGFTPGLGG